MPLSYLKVAMKFKDKHSGVVIEFTEDYDIKTMENHPDYIVITEEEKEDKKQTTLTLPKKDK